ncbi:MAG: hypothetical protein IPM96_14110 [Ignavibacteria bacterium]|nr:hypothetical protein [Ignavibacteria bacterium]
MKGFKAVEKILKENAAKVILIDNGSSELKKFSDHKDLLIIDSVFSSQFLKTIITSGLRKRNINSFSRKLKLVIRLHSAVCC